MGKHVVVDQKLCDKVWKLYRADMTRKEISEFLEIGRTTVDRIVNADFDAEQMLRMRKEKEKNAEAAKKSNAVNEIYSQTMLIKGEKDQTPAQITMDLEEEKKPASYQEAMDKFKEEKDLNEYDKKIMRFEAGQVDKICARLDKIYDLLGQALRRLDDGHTRNFKGPDQSEAAAEEERSRR